jgi:hypothetical protein
MFIITLSEIIGLAILIIVGVIYGCGYLIEWFNKLTCQHTNNYPITNKISKCKNCGKQFKKDTTQ